MSVLVDSSVWIDYLRDRRTVQTDYLERAMRDTELLTGDLILAEVLQGTTSDRAFETARFLMTTMPVISIADESIAIKTARNYRCLRNHGVTVRKTIDTLIATRCIEDGLTLLYSDRDFDPFVTHLGLSSATALGA